MIALCLDIGSSGIRAGLYDSATLAALGSASVCSYPEAPLTLATIRRTLKQTLAGLGDLSGVEIVSHSSFSPSLCVMGQDSALDGLPILGHADRRSLDQARRIERTIGADHFLHTVGNRPVPGGISVTSLCWLLENEPEAMRNVQTVGHVSTWLVRELTGQNVMDYSQACFTGLMDVKQKRWSEPILAALQINPAWLPSLHDADHVAGRVSPAAAREYGLPAGTPVRSGLIDTSAAILCSDLAPGTLIHSLGTTDVLAMLVERPHPGEHWLTRHLGTQDKWLSVVTLAAGGSMLDWLHRTLFAELNRADYFSLVQTTFAALPRRTGILPVTLCNTGIQPVTLASPAALPTNVQFEPYLAGSRLSVEQPTAAFTGLTLNTTRPDLLAAALAAYRGQTNDSLERLCRLQTPTGQVLITGGASPLADLLHADWPVHFRYKTVLDANLRGLAVLAAHFAA